MSNAVWVSTTNTADAHSSSSGHRVPVMPWKSIVSRFWDALSLGLATTQPPPAAWAGTKSKSSAVGGRSTCDTFDSGRTSPSARAAVDQTSAPDPTTGAARSGLSWATADRGPSFRLGLFDRGPSFRGPSATVRRRGASYSSRSRQSSCR
jgi:hypothetical protein